MDIRKVFIAGLFSAAMTACGTSPDQQIQRDMQSTTLSGTVTEQALQLSNGNYNVTLNLDYPATTTTENNEIGALILKLYNDNPKLQDMTLNYSFHNPGQAALLVYVAQVNGQIVRGDLKNHTNTNPLTITNINYQNAALLNLGQAQPPAAAPQASS